MSFRPLHDNVLIRRDEMSEREGKIHLPEKARKVTFFGVVIAAGPGKKDAKGRLIPMDVKVGDRVMFHNFGPVRYRDEASGEELLVCPANLLYGKFYEEEKQTD